MPEGRDSPGEHLRRAASQWAAQGALDGGEAWAWDPAARELLRGERGDRHGGPRTRKWRSVALAAGIALAFLFRVRRRAARRAVGIPSGWVPPPMAPVVLAPAEPEPEAKAGDAVTPPRGADSASASGGAGEGAADEADPFAVEEEQGLLQRGGAGGRLEAGAPPRTASSEARAAERDRLLRDPEEVSDAGESVYDEEEEEAKGLPEQTDIPEEIAGGAGGGGAKPKKRRAKGKGKGKARAAEVVNDKEEEGAVRRGAGGLARTPPAQAAAAARAESAVKKGEEEEGGARRATPARTPPSQAAAPAASSAPSPSPAPAPAPAPGAGPGSAPASPPPDLRDFPPPEPTPPPPPPPFELRIPPTPPPAASASPVPPKPPRERRFPSVPGPPVALPVPTGGSAPPPPDTAAGPRLVQTSPYPYAVYASARGTGDGGAAPLDPEASWDRWPENGGEGNDFSAPPSRGAEAAESAELAAAGPDPEAPAPVVHIVVCQGFAPEHPSDGVPPPRIAYLEMAARDRDGQPATVADARGYVAGKLLCPERALLFYSRCAPIADTAFLIRGPPTAPARPPPLAAYLATGHGDPYRLPDAFVPPYPPSVPPLEGAAPARDWTAELVALRTDFDVSPLQTQLNFAPRRFFRRLHALRRDFVDAASAAALLAEAGRAPPLPPPAAAALPEASHGLGPAGPAGGPVFLLSGLLLLRIGSGGGNHSAKDHLGSALDGEEEAGKAAALEARLAAFLQPQWGLFAPLCCCVDALGVRYLATALAPPGAVLEAGSFDFGVSGAPSRGAATDPLVTELARRLCHALFLDPSPSLVPDPGRLFGLPAPAGPLPPLARVYAAAPAAPAGSEGVVLPPRAHFLLGAGALGVPDVAFHAAIPDAAGRGGERAPGCYLRPELLAAVARRRAAARDAAGVPEALPMRGPEPLAAAASEMPAPSFAAVDPIVSRAVRAGASVRPSSLQTQSLARPLRSGGGGTGARARAGGGTGARARAGDGAPSRGGGGAPAPVRCDVCRRDIDGAEWYSYPKRAYDVCAECFSGPAELDYPRELLSVRRAAAEAPPPPPAGTGAAAPLATARGGAAQAAPPPPTDPTALLEPVSVEAWSRRLDEPGELAPPGRGPRARGPGPRRADRAAVCRLAMHAYGPVLSALAAALAASERPPATGASLVAALHAAGLPARALGRLCGALGRDAASALRTRHVRELCLVEMAARAARKLTSTRSLELRAHPFFLWPLRSPSFLLRCG
eukprot:tig00001110_g7080.t1